MDWERVPRAYDSGGGGDSVNTVNVNGSGHVDALRNAKRDAINNFMSLCFNSSFA